MTPRSLVHAIIVFMVISHGLVTAAPLQPVAGGTWSEQAGNLVGRLVVAQKKIKASEYFLLTLELRNVGIMPLAFPTGNPFTLTVRVLDGAGKQVNSTMVRMDVLCSPQWAVLPKASYLGFPVSIKGADGATGAHLDTTTSIWKLSPGTYRIDAEYSSDRFGEFKAKPTNITLWQGKLMLPAIDVEIEKGD
jgi:hypothetical protein